MRLMIILVSTALSLTIFRDSALAQNWQVVNCERSEIALAKYSECRMTDLYTGEARGSAGGQFYSQWAGYTGSDSLVYVFLQKSNWVQSSMVVTTETRESVLARPTARIASEGRNFSGILRVTGGHIRKFTMGDWYCFSFAKDAPPAPAGIEFWMYGYSCGKTPESQSERTAEAFLAETKVKKASR